MTVIGNVATFLDYLLPKTFDLPCNQEDKVDFASKIGLLSIRELNTAMKDPLFSGARWPFQQAAETNPLHHLWDWSDLNQHYITLRAEAIEGCDEALNDLGWLWLNVQDENSRELAARTLRLASNKGNSNALYNLAEQYYSGRGVPVNLPRAVELYEQASIDTKEASLKLGMLYEFGHEDRPDFEVDLGKAKKWYRQASVDGCCWGSYHMSCLALQESLPEDNPGNALYELQNLAMLTSSSVAISASEQLMHYFLHAGFAGDYEPLYIFWRDYAVEKGSYWANELKRQDSIPLGRRTAATKCKLRVVPL